MKRLLSILAAAAVASGLLVVGAYAAKKEEAAPGAVTAEQLKKGKADADGVVATAGLKCTIKNAVWLGSGSPVIDKKKVKADNYELACGEGLGYFVTKYETGTAQTFSCIQLSSAYEANGHKGPRCVLPENLNLNAQFQPIVDKTGLKCQVSDVSFLGTGTTDKMAHYEVACNGTGGYLVNVDPQGAPTDPISCLAASPDAAHYVCKLTPRTASIAELAAIAQGFDKACQVSDARFVGRDTGSQVLYYEVGCTGKPGFFLEMSKTAPPKSIDCLAARSIGDGCKLTDTAQIQASAGQSYAQVLKANGVSCTPTDTFVIGKEPRTKRDVVEFKCPEQPFGLVAVIVGAGATGRFEHYDCLGASERTVQCNLTKKSDLLALLKPILTAIDKVCTPTDYAMHGPDDGDGDTVEVKCSGAESGYILDLPADRAKTIKTMSCEQAARGEDKCTIAGNK